MTRMYVYTALWTAILFRFTLFYTAEPIIDLIHEDTYTRISVWLLVDGRFLHGDIFAKMIKMAATAFGAVAGLMIMRRVTWHVPTILRGFLIVIIGAGIAGLCSVFGMWFVLVWNGYTLSSVDSFDLWLPMQILGSIAALLSYGVVHLFVQRVVPVAVRHPIRS